MPVPLHFTPPGSCCIVFRQRDASPRGFPGYRHSTAAPVSNLPGIRTVNEHRGIVSLPGDFAA